MEISGKFRATFHLNGRSQNSRSRVQSQNHGTLLNPHFMNINGNLWIFMNFERALRVCLFLNTFLERSFEFVKCLVCQLCFCTLDFVWIPFSGVKFKIFSKSFQFFLPILINLVKNLTQNHLKKVYFPSFWSKSVWFLDQNFWQIFFYLSIELILTLPYLWNRVYHPGLNGRRPVVPFKVRIDTWRLAFISE